MCMSKASAKIIIISGSQIMTNFMRCADVFEKGKVIGTLKIMTVEYNEGEKISLKRVSVLIDKIKQSLIKEEIVSFIHVSEIKNGTEIIHNKGEILPYINRNVRCISDGKNWFVLSDFIEQKIGLKVITDEHKFITGVGIEMGTSEIKIDVKGIKKH
jgi:hypothetical protein